KELRGFEDCDAPKLFRHLVRGKAAISVHKNEVRVTFPRHAHNPILRAVPWHLLPDQIPGIPSARLKLVFK
ncbi:MAG: transposase, partial [Deltaproteobacteria bacterium]|nr:transposase [Deltaproteobacteria bacterium]